MLLLLFFFYFCLFYTLENNIYKTNTINSDKTLFYFSLLFLTTIFSSCAILVFRKSLSRDLFSDILLFNKFISENGKVFN